jgi:hypothetical protein
LDNIRDPVSIFIGIQSSGANWQVDCCLDDPFGYAPNPTLNSSVAHQPGQSFPAGVTVFPSSAFAGGGLAPGAGNAVGVITQAISAIRSTTTSSTSGGPVTMTWLQPGPR